MAFIPNYAPYQPVPFLRGEHIETIIPGLFRKPKDITPEYERIETPDGDFLELDWYRAKSPNLVVISHGLEGNSSRAYMKGMAKIFIDNGIDVISWNYRGCGPELNKKPILYHSGASYDLDTVVKHGIKIGYKSIHLIGFSLGGNITLKYVGEQASSIYHEIKSAIGFSVPVDLAAGCIKISKPGNRLYALRFLRNLKKKAQLKHQQFPDKFPLNGIDKINDLWAFDDVYTGPVHGFKNAQDYYNKSSSINFLENITIPALIVNAKNDPFLPDECYPYEIANKNDNITFETPKHGGHVGFMSFNNNGYYWSEKRALDFVKEALK